MKVLHCLIIQIVWAFPSLTQWQLPPKGRARMIAPNVLTNKLKTTSKIIRVNHHNFLPKENFYTFWYIFRSFKILNDFWQISQFLRKINIKFLKDILFVYSNTNRLWLKIYSTVQYCTNTVYYLYTESFLSAGSNASELWLFYRITIIPTLNILYK